MPTIDYLLCTSIVSQTQTLLSFCSRVAYTSLKHFKFVAPVLAPSVATESQSV